MSAQFCLILLNDFSKMGGFSARILHLSMEITFDNFLQQFSDRSKASLWELFFLFLLYRVATTCINIDWYRYWVAVMYGCECDVVAGVFLLVRIEVARQHQYHHSPLSHRRLPLATCTGNSDICRSLKAGPSLERWHLARASKGSSRFDSL